PQSKLRTRRPLEPELLAACSALNDLIIGGGKTVGHDTCGGSGDIDWSTLCGSSDGISAQQARLKAEAELAMAQAEPMARMQLQIERSILPKSSPNVFHDLSCVSLIELQKVQQDLLDRVKGFNEQLVGCLIERDSLQMEQDSMLVEVEDLTRYDCTIFDNFYKYYFCL
uniref:NET domain-containing protein n=1 Tax=Macrostomum lignano TaxID=282301 RepID=A0A1I8GKA3_9PLAT